MRTERNQLTRWVRALVLVTVPVALLVGTTSGALAQDGTLPLDAGARFSFNVPVGVVAVIIGIGGLVAGLVRRRRIVAARERAAVAPAVAMPGPRQPMVAAKGNPVS